MTEEIKNSEQKVEKSLEKLTVKELREIAMGIPHATAIHDMKKEEIIAFIKEARGIKDEAPAGKKKNIIKSKTTKAELKARIRELKKFRQEALDAKDKKTATELRYRISRLKKKTRRFSGT